MFWRKKVACLLLVGGDPGVLSWRRSSILGSWSPAREPCSRRLAGGAPIIFAPTLTFGQELWVKTHRTTLFNDCKRFLYRVAWQGHLRDRLRSSRWGVGSPWSWVPGPPYWEELVEEVQASIRSHLEETLWKTWDIQEGPGLWTVH